jgi:hypothetical protein
MQAMLTFEKRYRVPAYMGHNGWIDLDVEDEMDFDEVRQLALVSYKHFALKRMLDLPAVVTQPTQKPVAKALSTSSKRRVPKLRSKSAKAKGAPRANR